MNSRGTAFDPKSPRRRPLTLGVGQQSSGGLWMLRDALDPGAAWTGGPLSHVGFASATGNNARPL